MGKAVDKALEPLAGIPMLEHVLRACDRIEGSRQTLIVRSRHQQPVNSAGRGIEVAIQEPRPRGTAAALGAARTLIKPECTSLLVVFADNPLLTTATMNRALEKVEEGGAVIGLVTAKDPSPGSRGRVIRRQGRILQIMEKSACDPEELAITEVNCGAMALDAAWASVALKNLEPDPATGELYLTDLVGSAADAGLNVSAVQVKDKSEAIGCDDLASLSRAEKAYFRRRIEQLMAAGVRIRDPGSVEISPDTVVEPGTVIERGVRLIGSNHIGPDCTIGPNSTIEQTTMGQNCLVESSKVNGAACGENVTIGPNALIRPETIIAANALVGNCVEVKNSRIGEGTLIGHLCYVGDSDVGEGVVIGASAITCNFDGVDKHRTIIGDRAFIGSNVSLIAPIRIGEKAVVGAGSVVTRNVADGMTFFGNPARQKEP
jgi:bifunctional UDP-N-acetylglucosamine pyrophosphorylase/glucosamine-1-phosphate N-acetyltransferase